jgi:DNA-binding NtrC family response regulator
MALATRCPIRQSLAVSGEDSTTLQKGPASTRGPEQSLVLYHRDGTKVAPLPVGASLVVGRTWPSDVVVDDPSLSRGHARFTAETSGVTVEDLESTNGTWHNGKRVPKATLQHGDEVRLGDVTVCLHLAPWKGAPGAGLESHDRFLQRLADEAIRARTFGRSLAVLMVRSEAAEKAHVRHWAASLTALLRPVDHASLYADDTITIVAPELETDLGSHLASKLGSVRVGVALFPRDGTGADELLSAVQRSLASATGAVRVGKGEASFSDGELLAKSPRMQAMLADAARIATADLPVLILGETGSGKELVARFIHRSSSRKSKPLQSINCAAIPATLLEATLFGHERGAFTGADRQAKGIFEQAHKGTVLLDEVGELSPAAQAALLRVLETKKLTRLGGDGEIDADVRVIAATHRDLEAMAADGSFRRDLLYRLDAMTLEVPPLRERAEEIAPLVQIFVKGRASKVEQDAWEALRRYAWPGNVRELKNAIERAVALAKDGVITAADLPERVRSLAAPTLAPPEGGDFKQRVRDQMARYETDLILDALRQSGGNQAAAARLLGMPIRTLTHKIQTLGIKKSFG